MRVRAHSLALGRASEVTMSRARPFPIGLLPVGLLVLSIAGCSNPSYIELNPTSMELSRRGEMRRVAGRAMNHQGRYFPEIMFDWEIEDASVATVDEMGNVQAVGSGRTWVIARARGLDARAQVVVTLVEEVGIEEPEINLSASTGGRYVPVVTPLDARGRPLEGRRISLRSRNEDVVTVDGRGGLHAQNPGETEVVADVDGQTGIIRVTVTR
jgi:hypothetical protein